MEFSELIKVPKIDGVFLYQPHQPRLEGTLCITGYHLIFSARKTKADELWLLHRMIDSVDRKITPLSGTIQLRCKDFRYFKLDIHNSYEANEIANSLECLSNLTSVNQAYALVYRPQFNSTATTFQHRVQHLFNELQLDSNIWRISSVNEKFKVCRTYSREVIVPKGVSDQDLVAISQFRQGGRFPVLSYFHNRTKTFLLRSAQPLCGTTARRCREDEDFLKLLYNHYHRGVILDTRSHTAIQMAKTKGGGVELKMHYPLYQHHNCPVERHHAFLDSLSKLIEACNDVSCSTEKWFDRLEASGWLGHVADVLTCACLIAQFLDKDDTSVLVHGSEGTDSTLAVCSLAQVILNPRARTIEGFKNLVEHEWLKAGHPFWLRNERGGHFNSAQRTKDMAPTFLLFLDCVYQITEQFPCSFEFNDNFLIQLFTHSYASQFGTFLANCEKERSDLNLEERTVSFWSYLSQEDVLQTLKNPLYSMNELVVWPSVAPQSLVLWNGAYLRYVYDHQSENEGKAVVNSIEQRHRRLKDQVQLLRSAVLLQ